MARVFLVHHQTPNERFLGDQTLLVSQNDTKMRTSGNRSWIGQFTWQLRKQNGEIATNLPILLAH